VFNGVIYIHTFSLSNGVRQGGTIPPVLFNIYTDNLSVCLNNSKIGCKMNGVITDHIMYADDNCIIHLRLLHYTNCSVCVLRKKI